MKELCPDLEKDEILLIEHEALTSFLARTIVHSFTFPFTSIYLFSSIRSAPLPKGRILTPALPTGACAARDVYKRQGIDWRLPADKVILSDKDKKHPRLKDYQTDFDFNQSLYYRLF